MTDTCTQTRAGRGRMAFGPFQLHPKQRLLLRNGEPVQIGSRALELLLALLERSGELVSKKELFERAWPGMIVEESNLRAQIAALRRALGDGRDGARYLVVAKSRGYRFVAPVERHDEAGPETSAVRPAGLPVHLTRLIGRDDVVAEIAGRLERRRLITIVGSGGIGKTRVALAVAGRIPGDDSVVFVDLATISDGRLVPSLLATALGLPNIRENPVSQVVESLRGKQVLLLLDNCEHVVEAAAILIEQILKGARMVRVLTTSREPLRVEDESVYRLPPLDVPLERSSLSARDAANFAAVQLFVERAAQCVDAFDPTDDDAVVIAAICRRLDGIPLAIELTAARVDAFGLRGLSELLGDRLLALGAGRRTGLPRQQTLTGALDWSYDLLSDLERRLLGRFAVFVGSFNMDAAAAIGAEPGVAEADIIAATADLVSKSLVVAKPQAAETRYHLLETTRAYAAAKLSVSGEREQVARRHADYHLACLDQASAELLQLSAPEWRARFEGQIGNVRSALAWAFSESGDRETAVALTVAAAPFLVQLSLLGESRGWIGQALALLDPSDDRSEFREMKLNAALGSIALHLSVGGEEMANAWGRVRQIAVRLGDAGHRLQALWGLWVCQRISGNHHTSLEIAREFRHVAAGTADAPVGERLVGITQYFLGDLVDALRHLDRALDDDTAWVRRDHAIRFQFDHRVSVLCFRAQIRLLQGFPDEAVKIANRAVEEARGAGQAHSICFALTHACPIALFVGDLAGAGRHVDLLLETSGRYGMEAWHARGRCYLGVLLVRRGDVREGAHLVGAMVDDWRKTAFTSYYVPILAELAAARMSLSDFAGGHAAADEALVHAERVGERWCLPELLRTKAELVIREGALAAAVTAEGLLLQALECARRQGALAWELRAATSLAALRASLGRATEARDLLASVYGRLSEGFDTADLQSAQRLLKELS